MGKVGLIQIGLLPCGLVRIKTALPELDLSASDFLELCQAFNFIADQLCGKILQAALMADDAIAEFERMLQDTKDIP